MKIERMQVHSIAIADPPLRSSYGLHAPYALRNVVELTSHDGVTGISETYGGDAPREALESLRPQVIGADPFRLLGSLSPLVQGSGHGYARSQTFLVPGENPLDASTRTYAAIEIACLDLIGQSFDRPVCDLIGGRVRDRVPFSAYAFYKHGGGGGEGMDAREDEYGEVLSAQALVREVGQMVAKYGFESVKLKGGVLDPRIEVETIRLLREQFGPDVPLRIDPNCAWSVQTSIEVGKNLAQELSGGGYLEDPTSELQGMAEVRKGLLDAQVDTPLATNVAVTSFADIPISVELDAAQIVLCDPHYWGGMRQVQHLGTLCRVFGLGLSMHSNSHLGVSLMAMAHVAAATSHLTYACDTHYPWQSAEDEIVLGGRIPFSDGCVRVTDEPGLGVQLDYDQLARGVERYSKLNYRKRDDEAEMQKHVDPNWRRVLPRW